MSRTKGHCNPRPKLAKLVDRYTGWLGEAFTKAYGRRFIKRLTSRHNRRVKWKVMF